MGVPISIGILIERFLLIESLVSFFPIPKLFQPSNFVIMCGDFANHQNQLSEGFSWFMFRRSAVADVL